MQKAILMENIFLDDDRMVVGANGRKTVSIESEWIAHVGDIHLYYVDNKFYCSGIYLDTQLFIPSTINLGKIKSMFPNEKFDKPHNIDNIDKKYT